MNTMGNKEPRRDLFLKTCGLCAGVGLLSGVVRAGEINPNILIVMVDDLAPDAVFEGRFPFFYEYFQEEFAPGIPTILAVRTPEWKYIHLPHESAKTGNFDELYNIKKDPHELRNLIFSPETVQQVEWMQRLLKQAQKRYGYTEPPYRYTPHQSDADTKK